MNVAESPEPRTSLPPNRGFGWSWMALAVALACHVTDEALTGFLSVYNPAVHTLRRDAPWLPLPTFTLGEWLTGLALGIAVLVALTPIAFRGSQLLAVVALPFSVLMMANGVGHLAASVYLARLMPGSVSSPILIAAAVATFLCARSTVLRRRARNT